MSDQSPPKVRDGLDWTALDLDPEEGFVLSRIDGQTDSTSLAQVTGLAPSRIDEILTKLESQGALSGGFAPPAVAPKKELAQAKAALDPNDLDATIEGDALDDEGTAAEGNGEDPAKDDDDTPHDATEDAAGDDDSGEDEDEEEVERAEADYRKVYVEKFRELEGDERVKIAQTARGTSLCALCFDPDHRVIAAVLENGRVTQKHGRLIAKHHRTATGLDRLGRVVVFLRDRTTQRFLVRNPQLSDALFRKMMAPKRLLDVFHMTANREATEKVRRTARKVFRTKFQTSTAEERVQLIFSCEGRCLPPLLGITFDGRTTALLCRRTIQSTLLIQNLCRFPGTPPALLNHMAKSPIVKRMPQLRALIKQHPNCPSTLKKSIQ